MKRFVIFFSTALFFFSIYIAKSSFCAGDEVFYFKESVSDMNIKVFLKKGFFGQSSPTVTLDMESTKNIYVRYSVEKSRNLFLSVYGGSSVENRQPEFKSNIPKTFVIHSEKKILEKSKREVSFLKAKDHLSFSVVLDPDNYKDLESGHSYSISIHPRSFLEWKEPGGEWSRFDFKNVFFDSVLVEERKYFDFCSIMDR